MGLLLIHSTFQTPPFLNIRTYQSPLLLPSSSSSSSSCRHGPKRTSRVPALTTNASITGSDRNVQKKGIAEFYDESLGLWEDIWGGDHMHQGFYDPSSQASGSLAHHRAAQIRLIEEALCFAGVSEDPKQWPKNVVDVGCGMGGSSRYLSRKFGAKCQGVTLSPVEAQRATALAAEEGLVDKVSFQVGDALDQPFPDEQFDLVWSLESGEHMPDKRKFVGELARVAAPGATIILVTCCHRDLGPTEESLQAWEKEHLRKLCDALYLPQWCSTAEYVKSLQSLDLQHDIECLIFFGKDIKTADWSQHVAPFWPAFVRMALTWKGLTSIFRSGLKTIRGVLVMPLMFEGYRKGVIKYSIITCRKPE